MNKQAVEESPAMSLLGWSGLGRALSPSQRDRLNDRGFLNRSFRGMGRDLLTQGGAIGGSITGGLTGGGLAKLIALGLGHNPEKAVIAGIIPGLLAGGLGGAYGGYQAGGGNPPPLSFMDKLRLLNKPASVMNKQATIYYTAFSRRLNELAGMEKQAGPGMGLIEGVARVARPMFGRVSRRVAGGAARLGADIADPMLSAGRGAATKGMDIVDPSLSSATARARGYGHFGSNGVDVVDPSLGASVAGGGGADGGIGAGGAFGNMFGRFQPHIDQAKAWMKANPGTTGAIGGGIGGAGLMGGYDHMQENARRRAMAEAPFGSRLMMALSYLANPQGVADRMY